MNHQKNCNILVASICFALCVFCIAIGFAAPDQPSGLANAKGIWTDPAYGDWHSCVMGGGGNLIDMAVCPSNPKRTYCYGDMDGLFRSDDGGDTWRMIHGGMDVQQGRYEFAGLAVDPKDANSLAVASGGQFGPRGGVYLSGDGGKTWRKTLDARFMGNGPLSCAGPRLAGSCAPHGVIIAATEGSGVWRSADGGQTWSSCGLSGIYFTDVYFDKHDSNKIWLCAEPINLGSGGEFNQLNGGLYRSDDKGKTWVKLSDDSPFEVMSDPKINTLLFGLWDSGLKQSANSGVSWSDVDGGLPKKSGMATGESPFYAIGSGPDFTVVVQTMPTIIYRQQSGQSTWQKTVPTLSKNSWRLGFTNPPAGHASSIVISPTDPNHWYLLDEWGMYQSFDSGHNWTPSNAGIETTVLHTLFQDPTNPNRVYLGAGDVGFWSSGDDGTVFTQTDSSMAGWVGNVKCIDCAPVTPSRMYLAGGEGWRANRVFVSTDSGKSLTLLPLHNNGLPTEPYACDSVAADPKDPMTAYLTTSAVVTSASGGVYRTTDGGETWSWMGQGLPVGKQVFNDNIWWGGREIAIGADGVLLAVSADCNGVFRFNRSTGSWDTLSLQHTGGMYSVVADPANSGRFYVCVVGDDSALSDTDGGLYRTDNDGDTWTKLLHGTVRTVAVDDFVKNRIAVSTRNGVLLSSDAGSTWSGLEPMPNRWYDECLAFAGNRLIAGTGGNGAFWIDLSLAKEVKRPLSGE